MAKCTSGGEEDRRYGNHDRFILGTLGTVVAPALSGGGDPVALQTLINVGASAIR